jgi:ribosomal protein L19E
MFTDLKFAEKCVEINELKYNNQQIVYDLDKSKPSPTREPITRLIEENVIQYMKEKNHCEDVSPILDKKSKSRFM